MRIKNLIIGISIGIALVLGMGNVVHVGGVGTYEMEVVGNQIVIMDTRTAQVEVSKLGNLPAKEQSERKIKDWR